MSALFFTLAVLVGAQGQEPAAEAPHRPTVFVEFVDGETGKPLPRELVEKATTTRLDSGWTSSFDESTGWICIAAGSASKYGIARMEPPEYGCSVIMITRDEMKLDSDQPIRAVVFRDADLKVNIPEQYLGNGYKLMVSEGETDGFPIVGRFASMMSGGYPKSVLLPVGQTQVDFPSVSSNVCITLRIVDSSEPRSSPISEAKLVLRPEESRSFDWPSASTSGLSGTVRGQDGKPIADQDLWIVAASEAGTREALTEDRDRRWMSMDSDIASVIRIVSTDSDGEFSFQDWQDRFWVGVAPKSPYGLSFAQFVELDPNNENWIELATNHTRLNLDLSESASVSRKSYTLKLRGANPMWHTEMEVRFAAGPHVLAPEWLPDLRLKISGKKDESEWVDLPAGAVDEGSVQVAVEAGEKRGYRKVHVNSSGEHASEKFALNVIGDPVRSRAIGSFSPFKGALSVNRALLPGWVYLFNARYEMVAGAWAEAGDRVVKLSPVESTQVVIIDRVADRHSFIEVMVAGRTVAHFQLSGRRFVAPHLPTGQVDFRIWTYDVSEPEVIRKEIESGAWNVIELPN